MTVRGMNTQAAQADRTALKLTPEKPLLRHQEDMQQIGCTALFFLVFGVAWHCFTSPFSNGLISFVTWLALFQLSFMGAVSTHNAVHLPLFWDKTLNSLYQICLSLQYGGSVSIFVPGHNLSHHKYPQQARDVSNKDDKLYFAAQARLNRPIVRQRRLEEVVVLGAASVLLFLDWQRWIWYALLPQFYAKYCILSLNLLQHDGCDIKSKYNFARNFTNPLLNRLCFNNGYHTVHHLYPGLHWSVLPQKHQELIAPHIAPSLEDPSILSYMWRSFIWPGVRLDYLGKPLVITKEETEMQDEPWFYDEKEVYSKGTEHIYLAEGME